jgi:hypothetical protein
MGLLFSRIWERLLSKLEMRILMVGLDAAGKVRVGKKGTKGEMRKEEGGEGRREEGPQFKVGW